MQVDKKNVKDWETILLDTGLILALFRAKNGSMNPEILFVKKLISYLCHSQTANNKDRIIYISTITIGEILTKEVEQQQINRILRILDSNNVEFLAFDVETSLQFNIRMKPYLDKEKVHSKAKEIGFETQDYGMARQWISKDYMIAMTAFTKKADVILTLDKKTFYPICKDFENTECVLAYPELFLHSEQFIFEYDYANADNFVNGIKFKSLNQIDAEKPQPITQADLWGNPIA